jgi:hypothetical protein
VQLTPDQRPIFVAGLHRSGTSIVFRCLREHPEVSGFRDTGVPEDEGQHLQSVYAPAHRYGGPGKFGFAPEAALDEHSPLVGPESRASLLTSWGQYWDRSKRLLLEKSPPNLIRMRFLQALFPTAHFVAVLRHPLPVALATQKWSHTSIESLVAHWLTCHERFRRDQPAIRRLHVVRYERFVERPQQALDDIYTWLEVPLHRNQLPIQTRSDARYAAAWREHLQTFAGREEARRMREAYGERLRSFGYDIDWVEAL